MFVVIAYDVVNDRRRARLAELLAAYGQRAQRSVFECHLDAAGLNSLRREAEAIIDPGEDDLRFYGLCDRCLERVALAGRARLSQEPEYFIV